MEQSADFGAECRLWSNMTTLEQSADFEEQSADFGAEGDFGEKCDFGAEFGLGGAASRLRSRVKT